MTPAGRDLAKLLRWYPRAWRERYGEEFLALVEDTLDGRGPGWRLRLAMAGCGLRERGHQAGRASRRVLPGVARGFAGTAEAVVTVAAYLLAILPHELGVSPARPAGLALEVLTGLLALAGLAPLSASPAYACGLFATLLALAVALAGWGATAAVVARRLDLGPRLRAAETTLGAVAVPAIVILAGASTIWYSVISSSFSWLVWGGWWLVRTGPRVTKEVRRGAG